MSLKTKQELINLHDLFTEVDGDIGDKVIIAVSPYGLFKMTYCGTSCCFCNLNSTYGGLSGIHRSFTDCIKSCPEHTRFYMFDDADDFISWYIND